MEHVFIINPAAGSGEYVGKLREELKSVSVPITVYETQYSGDGRRYVGDYCLNRKGAVRFYACGGDGTIQEVAEGLVGFEQAEFTCYPCGTGNDYVKYFGGAELFRSVGGLMAAETRPIDLIRMNDRISVNIVNFGFDTCVARTMAQVKHKPLIGGRNAYSYGVFRAVLTAMKNRAEITVDGERLNPDGFFLLCTAANGQYVGGQFRCAPRSVNDDGLMDVCMVKPISLARFLKLLPSYTEGNHLDDPNFSDILTYRRCRKLEVKAPEGFAISLDGEIVQVNEFACEVMPKAVRFAVPDSNQRIAVSN